MGNHWTDELKEHGGNKARQQNQQSDFSAEALAEVPGMLDKLCDAMEADLAAFGGNVCKERTTNSITLSRKIYPTFVLQIQPEHRRAILTYTETRKQNSDRAESRRKEPILIVRTGPTEFCYRWEGRDYAREPELSEVLLKPLFAFVDQ
ncbi:MAG: hypothetical protein ABSC93_17365 [Bryobacteraceae bacterium]